ncbi:MAG: hypothetical protein R2867_02935 [Caldilineaceae bacterium]
MKNFMRWHHTTSALGVVGEGRGRLLRSPTLWEDVVKTIATTNVTWRNTVSMIHRLVDTLGAPFPIDPTKAPFLHHNKLPRSPVLLLTQSAWVIATPMCNSWHRRSLPVNAI